MLRAMGELFERLAGIAEERGATVIRHARRPGEQAGYFRVYVSMRDGSEDPVVCVRAVSGHAAQFDDLEDVCTLAHELGHHHRWKHGLEHAEYRAIVDVPTDQWPGFARVLREAIVAEENAAWELARAELDALGFTGWSTFEARRAESVGSYVRSLLATA